MDHLPFAKVFSKLPLRTVLIVPFVLQIFTAVGLTGYFSFRNGQRAVNDLATQLRSQATEHIHNHLNQYLTEPKLINQLNFDAIARGELNLNLNQKNPQATIYL